MNPIWYITSIRPAHPLTGDKVIVTIREYNEEEKRGETYTHITTIPHRFFTSPQDETTIPELQKNIEKLLKQETASSQQETTQLHKHYFYQDETTTHYIVSLDGPKETKAILPKPFITSDKPYNHRHLKFSPSTYLRYLYPPFTQIDNPTHLPQLNHKHLSRVSPHHLIEDTHVTLDIELEGWKEGKDQIFMVIYLSPSHQILLHNLPHTIPELNNITLVRYNRQQELGDLLTELIRTDDPLWIFGHNIMTFDQIKIRNITERYHPGTQGRTPIIKSVQGLGKVITQGRFTLDTYKYAKNHFSLFQNAKLETLIGFEKSINYEEQEQLLKEAKLGNASAFITLATYCIHDGLHAEDLALKLRPQVANTSLLLGRDPDTICATSLPTIVNDYYERRHFYIKQYPSRKNVHTEKRNIPAKEYVHTLLTTNILTTKTTIITNQTEKPTPTTKKRNQKDNYRSLYGFHKHASIFTLTPFVSAAKNLLQDHHLIHEIDTTSDPITKLDYLHILQELLRPLFEQTIELATKVPPEELNIALQRLSKRYGFKPNTASSFKHKLHQEITIIKERLQTYTYLNSSPLVYIIKEKIDANTLEQQHRGCFLGYGPVLSLNRGRFVADPFNNYQQRIYQGINTTYHSRSTFEKNILQAIIDKFFEEQTRTHIQEYLKQELEKFKTQKTGIEQYYIKSKTRSFYKHEFEQVLNQSTAEQETKHAFHLLRHRIHDHFSPEGKKELEEIVNHTQNCYAYPYLKELAEKILSPYPPHTNLIYIAGTEYIHRTKTITEQRAILRPATEGHKPSLKIYHQRALKTLEDILKIVNNKEEQLKLL